MSKIIAVWGSPNSGKSTLAVKLAASLYEKQKTNVIVDCTSSLENTLSEVALRSADRVIRIATPDLKCISFYVSQLPLLADPTYRAYSHFQVLNVTDADRFLPIEEAKTNFKDIATTLPYSREVKKQSMEGSLIEKINNKKFSLAVCSIADKAVL